MHVQGSSQDLGNGWTHCAQIWYSDGDRLIGCRASQLEARPRSSTRVGLNFSLARLSPQKAHKVVSTGSFRWWVSHQRTLSVADLITVEGFLCPVFYYPIPQHRRLVSGRSWSAWHEWPLDVSANRVAVALLSLGTAWQLVVSLIWIFDLKYYHTF